MPVEIALAGQVKPQDAGDFIDAIVTVAQPADLDAGLTRHQGAAFIDRVARLNQPGVGADCFDITGDIEHQLQIAVVAKADTAIIVAM